MDEILNEEQMRELEDIVARDGIHFYAVCDFCTRHGFQIENILEDLIRASYLAGYSKGMSFAAELIP